MEKETVTFGLLGSVFTFLFGAFDIPLQILMVFMCCDVAVGLLKGWYTGKLSSQQGYKGLIKKAGILFVIIIATMVDILTGQLIFRIPVCYFFIAIEGISILENLAQIGVPIPSFLLDKLAQLKDQEDK